MDAETGLFKLYEVVCGIWPDFENVPVAVLRRACVGNEEISYREVLSMALSEAGL